MKILRVNPLPHAEAGNKYEDIIVLPETSIVRQGFPFFMPDWAPQWYFSFFIGSVITRLGKCIASGFASRYRGHTVLIAQACPLSSTGEALSLPEGFDGSILLGNINDDKESSFVISREPLKTNGQSSYMEYICNLPSGYSSLIDDSIAYVSSLFTLHTGDIIIAGPISTHKIKCEPDTRLTARDSKGIIFTHKIK